MKIIISPAKKMRINNDFLEPCTMPIFLDKSKQIVQLLQQKSIDELEQIFQANRKITLENYERYQRFDFYQNLSPAVLAYDGIQYTYMGANVFTTDQYEYLKNNLYILSGLYGVLKAFDGIRPYRLEMQAKLEINGCHNLYEFWKDSIYQEIFKDKDIVINLTSEEYKKVICKYLKEEDHIINVYFYELHKGKFIEKAVYVKMARGALVRYMAVNKIEDIEDIKEFNEFGFSYSPKDSTNRDFVFIKSKV